MSKYYKAEDVFRIIMCSDTGINAIMMLSEDSMPSIEVSESDGEWQITECYPHNVYCSQCHKRFAQTHWAVWEDGSLPRNYCPNCGAKMKGARNE